MGKDIKTDGDDALNQVGFSALSASKKNINKGFEWMVQENKLISSG